ncbi:MAG TPA: ABC transporter permease [Opitutaceae bacterium]|nr:ABC transporter permease [Opitutaceae bacterium]
MSRFLYEIIEALRIAFAQIRANKMRSALTALGVIIGIVAVTLMGTAIRGIDAGVDRSLSGFGDDLLYVSKWPWRDVEDWWNYRNRRAIKTEYAAQVNEWIEGHPDGPLKRAIPAAGRSSTIVRGDYRVNNIYTLGTTADYARTNRSEMKEGRFFSDFESQNGRAVCIIGFDVADALFPGESALGKAIRISGVSMEVVGVAARQGSFLGLWSWDSMVALPLSTFRRNFSVANQGELRVQVDSKRMAEAKDELRGLMRRIRQLGPEQRDDFEINEQSAIRDQLDPIKNGIAIAGLFITGLALFVGAIGIMNITYVSVKERTREIGTRKALGARRRTILLQFLIEAVCICMVGGLVGLGLAGGLSSAVAVMAPSFPLVFSTGLVVTGLAISVLTGIFSGFAPAWQASKLDPVVALRYE